MHERVESNRALEPDVRLLRFLDYFVIICNTPLLQVAAVI